MSELEVKVVLRTKTTAILQQALRIAVEADRRRAARWLREILAERDIIV